MKVRTGTDHGYPIEEALKDQFKVGPLPVIDFAARALRNAQDDYFKRYPEARKFASDLYWVIEKK